MTIQPTEAPAIDLELLVGEMPEVACEQTGHDDDKEIHDNGPAKFYGRGVCSHCGYVGRVKAICAAFTAYAVSDGLMVCLGCRGIGLARDLSQILGPVK